MAHAVRSALGGFSRYIVAAVAVAAIGMAAAPLPIASAAATAQMTPPEYQFLSMVNADRQANGLPSLAANDVLSTIARQRSQQLLSTGVFTHFDASGSPVFASMLNATGFPYALAGENLARNNYHDFLKSLDVANSGLMASPTHRANILNSAFNELGVGIVGPDVSGMYYYTEIFAEVS